MSYVRVLPRDLFNEAKLLKCIGMLTLAHHNQAHDIWSHIEIDLVDPEEGFKIEQGPSGEIYVANISFFDANGENLFFYTQVNARSHWPLLIDYNQLTLTVFNEDGTFTEDFLDLLSNSIK